MTVLHDLFNLGQSIWYDNLRRQFNHDGTSQGRSDNGVVGVTSNPSMFEKAIAQNDDYDPALEQLVKDGVSDVNELYEALALEDIRNTAELFLPIYEKTDGLDGYVSLEVSPTLAHDTEGTIEEARRLYAALDMPNIMIKVPGTPEGIPAIETLISDGISINVTLLFSVENYQQVAEAYIKGLQTYAANGGDVSKVASVASFFVSRVDSATDKALEEAGNSELQGKIAIANAKVSYALYQNIYAGEAWKALAAKGARPQRLLWASTSTKNPAYPDTLYMDSLIGPETVNTVPPSTLEAFMDHGTVATTLTEDMNEAASQMDKLAELGIDFGAITDKLQSDGVASFAKSFESLMASIEEKSNALKAEASLG